MKSLIRTCLCMALCFSFCVSASQSYGQVVYTIAGVLDTGYIGPDLGISSGESFVAEFTVDLSVVDSDNDPTRGEFNGAILSSSIEFSGGYISQVDFAGGSVNITSDTRPRISFKTLASDVSSFDVALRDNTLIDSDTLITDSGAEFFSTYQFGSMFFREPTGIILMDVLAPELPTFPVTAAPVFDAGPSDPTLFDTVINVPSDRDTGLGQSVGADGLFTQLNVSDGGSVGNFFIASFGSEINISGGTVGTYFHSRRGSELNISGGSFGRGFCVSNEVTNISGGSFGIASFHADVTNISGGSIADHFDASGELNISGGSIGSLTVRRGSEVNISGGTIGGNSTFESCEVNLFGSNFVLDGVPMVGLTTGEAFSIDSSREVTLSGLLADGSAFSFDLGLRFGEDRFDKSPLTVTLVSAGPEGDMNSDGSVNFLDIMPFIEMLSSGDFHPECDLNHDEKLDFLDIEPFIEHLVNQS